MNNKEIYLNYQKKIKAYDFINYLISWDNQTEAPKKAIIDRDNYIKIFAEERFKLQTSNEYFNVVQDLLSNKDELDEVFKRELEIVYKQITKIKKIPMDEYISYEALLSQSYYVWLDAKEKSDFSIFEKTLEQIVAYKKKIIKYLETDEIKGYDVLLDEYEVQMTTKDYDIFFDTLKKDLVPFAQKIANMNLCYNNKFENDLFDVEKQKEFVSYIEDVMCFDRERGLGKTSEHPFTSGYGINDVRYTVHYYDNLLSSSIFSAIHELGHSLYQQQISPSLSQTFLCDGSSLAIHESQSRFYENIVGRSYEFWERHYTVLKEIFKPKLDNISLDDFYKSINKVEMSITRTEADEVTYPLHIMIRYDIEKMLFNDGIKVKDMPRVFNELTKKYLNIDIKSDKEGILQDVHWACGDFGYFPTYALGSAYASQFYYAMNKDLDVSKAFNEKNLSNINKWFKDNVHKYGASLYPKEIIKKATKENFNPNYYIKYLTEKYSKIYGLTNDKIS